MIFLIMLHTEQYLEVVERKQLQTASLYKVKPLRRPAVVVFLPLCRRPSFSLNQSSGNWSRVGPL